MGERTCVDCGATVQFKTNAPKRCKPCQTERHRIYKAEWAKAHPRKWVPKPRAVKVKPVVVRAKPAACTCERCGCEYTPKQQKPNPRFCSRKCKEDQRNADLRQATADAKPATRTCAQCGADFGTERRADAIYCCRACLIAAHSQSFYEISGYGRKDERYTRMFARGRVAERDQWRCGICGDPVDHTVRWPDLMCASIDHVVPLSHGGTNAENNLRLAHLGCNVRRSNRIERLPK